MARSSRIRAACTVVAMDAILCILAYLATWFIWNAEANVCDGEGTMFQVRSANNVINKSRVARASR